jgi:hypothetical protein
VFEQDTETIINTVKQRIPHSITDSSTIVVKDILASEIPLSLKSFFRADVEILLTEELTRQWKNSRFNFSHPEVQSLQHQINSFLVIHYSLQKNEFYQRLDDAVHLMINYLIRPQWTLANVIFEQGDTISTAKLMRLLKYFGPYEYIRSLILRYIEDRRISQFTKSDFSNILWKVDGQFIRRKTGDQIAKILTPLFELMEYPLSTGINKLPVKSLVKHFADKGLASAVQRLEDEANLGTLELSRYELGEILESVRRRSGAFEVVHQVPDIQQPPSHIQQMEPPEQEPEEPIGEQTTLPQPILELFENSTSFDADIEISEAATAVSDTTNPLEQQAQIEKPPFLLYSITDSDRKRFIKKIFKQDNMAFLNALRKIDELPTWRQASVYIDEIFIENDVDPYSSEAIRFIDIIQEKYYPKK